MTPSPLLYLQSGGPTAVLNASALGAIEGARHAGHPLYAARDGLAGLLRGDLVDTGRVADAEVARLAALPGASFGVSRHMIADFDQAPDEWLALRDVLERYDIHHLLINGGNGSIGCAARLSAFERHTGYPLTVVGIPKTIDNDLFGTDFSPGFPSAARFLATTMREVALDMNGMGPGRVFVMETMGRHTGWLAAATAAAAARPGDAPQLILLPEAPFDEARFLAALDDCLARHGHCAITVAEGLCGTDGRPVAESRHDSVYGHEQLGGAGDWIAGLIRARSGITAHVAQVDCLQRAARHHASAIDLQLARACGRVAVEWALGGRQGVMTGIVREGDAWRLAPADMADIGDRERMLPPAFLGGDGLSVSPALLDYLRPLLIGEAVPPSGADGLPDGRAILWPAV